MRYTETIVKMFVGGGAVGLIAYTVHISCKQGWDWVWPALFVGALGLCIAYVVGDMIMGD
jgi:hypothetical protein